MLTLFRPADGRVRVEGTKTCPNADLHPWLKQELGAILADLPTPLPTADASRAAWDRWQAGPIWPITLPAQLPPLRVLLMLDNLAGHRTPDFVLWLFAYGVMPLYTPLGGSWLNMAESIQRVLKRRALDGQHPASTRPAPLRSSPGSGPSRSTGTRTRRHSCGVASDRPAASANASDDTPWAGLVLAPGGPSAGVMATGEASDRPVFRHP